MQKFGSSLAVNAIYFELNIRLWRLNALLVKLCIGDVTSDWQTGFNKGIRFYHQKRFRSQSSNNMDKWKAENRRVEERTAQEGRRNQKKEDTGAQNVKKFAKHGGSKNRFAKAGGAEPCGHMRNENLHAVVTRRLQIKIHKTPCSNHLENQISKNCTLLWHEALSQFKTQEPHHVRTTFGRFDVERLHDSAVKNAESTPAPLLWRGAHCQVKMLKAWTLYPFFEG